MNKLNKHFLTVALTATITAAAFAGAANANLGEGSVKLLTAQFEPRQVVQVDEPFIVFEQAPTEATIVNVSSEVIAKVITFRLQ